MHYRPTILRTVSTAALLALSGNVWTSCAQAQSVSVTGDVDPTLPGSVPSWTVGGDLRIGWSGTGTLLVENGGSVDSADGVLGSLPGSSGSAMIRGAGSSWSSTGLNVGIGGIGTLNIEDGGAANAATTHLGQNGTGQGALILSGTAGARGQLTTSQVARGAGAGTLTFNGGILRATADQVDFLSGFDADDVTIVAGGAILDSNGRSIGIAAPLGGTGDLIKTGAGTLTLSGANTYAGATRVEGGTLVAQGGSATPDTSAVIVTSGTYRVADDETIGSLSGSGTVSVAAGQTLTTGVNDQDATFAGSLTGGGSLEVVGDGRFTLTGTSTLGGDVTVCCSSLDIRGNVALDGDAIVYGGSLSVSNGGRLTAAGAAGVMGGSLTVSGGGLLEADAFGTVTGGDFVVSGSGSIARSGVATFMAVLGNGHLTVTNGGRLETIGDAEVGYGITATVDGANSAWGVDQNLYVGNDDVGPGSLTLANGGEVSADTISIGQDSTLQIGIAGRAGRLVTPVVTNAGTLVFDHSDDVSFAGTVAGVGTLAKSGTGRLSLTGSNTYTGSTTVAGGTLAVDGTLASTGVQVQPGATLTGAGSLAGTVTVADGATLGGASGRTLSIGSLALAPTANLQVELSASGTDPLFDIAGDLTLEGRLIIDESSDLSGATSFDLFRYGGTLTNTPLTLADAPIGYKPSSFALETTAGQVTLHVVPQAGEQHWAQGSGTWGSTGTNWRDVYGNLATAWEGDTAIFGGGGGTVTVDGTQSFSALRFEADGYSIVPGTGGALTIAGPRGDVRVESGRTAIIAAPIGGTGQLAKGGAGTLILSGINTYRGGTWLAGGTLGINSDANLGEAAGGLTIEGGATLRAMADLATARSVVLGSGGGTLDSDSHVVVLSGSIQGTGSLTKFGTGTLSLVGLNTYAGGTIVSAGTLVGTATSFGSGLIVTNGDLVIDQSADASLANPIGGTGRVTKTGSGLLELTGTSTLSGPTSVAAGRLAVNGLLASSPVTVQSDAVLSGTGTIGGIVAQSGASIAPGNSIGTLHVAGNVAFGAGSTYQMEIDGAGRSDRIGAEGRATLSGGTVQVLPDQGTGYKADSPYTILTARQGVSGRFAGTLGGTFAFITPTLNYSADAVTLTMVRKVNPPTPPDPPTPPTPPVPPQPVAFHSVAVTHNQYDTADGVEALGEGNRLYDIILGSSVPGARQAFDALSGEAHSSAASVAYGDARQVQQAILSRLRQSSGSNLPAFVRGTYSAAYAADVPGAAPQPVTVAPSFNHHRFAVWGEGFGSWGRTRSNGNAAALDASTGGFILGAEAQVDPAFRLGMAGGFSRTAFDVDARLSSGANETTFGALYGSGTRGAVALRLGGSYAHHDIDVSRTVSFPGFADRTGTSYDGSTLLAFGEVGYRVAWAGATLEPFAGASLLRLHTNAFREEGGVAALAGLARDYNLGSTTLGVRAEAQVSAEVPLLMHGMVGWRRAYGDVEPQALIAFRGGASTFAVSGTPVDRNALVAEAGFDWQISPVMTLGASYTGQIGSRAQDHALKGNFTWRFDTY